MIGPMIDLLIYLMIIGGVVAVGGALIWGICSMIGRIRTIDAVRRRREARKSMKKGNELND